MQIPKDLIESAQTKISGLSNPADFYQLRSSFLGKNSHLTKLFSSLKDLPKDEKIAFAKELNSIKSGLEALFEDAFSNLSSKETSTNKNIDLTLPGINHGLGSLHPISIVTEKIASYFETNSYSVFFGNEVESDFYNFEALNFPANHPARQMHDTFYVEDDQSYLLRTHTSNTQIHAMMKYGAPLKMLSPGRVYRCDSDNTHLPMFTQVEGLVVDPSASFGKLKGTLINFLHHFFDDEMEVRFRPSFFPFTEPSAEVDIRFGKKGWLEVLGCGMVHPNVLKGCGINPAQYNGFAFGMGIERLAMLYFGVEDIRDFYNSDLEFLQQFRPSL
ncbi:MAG: phenylalanine--tRNA ligase subunit alpha [Gammaproteobacteria bacterium]